MSTPTAAIPRLGSIVLDCPDTLALARFYATLLDWPEPEGDERWATVRPAQGGTLIQFQRVDDFRAPTWPEGERPQMLHLDLTVDDMEASHERALKLGARLLDEKPEHFRVYADPAGHPFCLCV
ncbi:hypothetical protein EV193_101519 [Herbihabitans rhizosphaerae]|uniref:Glyoxalase-like domain-containing protein n=1 Tax=Herbihabitans rhizosphaerae TaxID=1872711 RepID=A0A4V2EUI0_9PSEU|nr:VOC family protein [Herbihabitans rhizosphaerae]RZS44643.1 hypothetical protein EV193_101519 [Herbihabitans rhizosphaerae]